MTPYFDSCTTNNPTVFLYGNIKKLPEDLRKKVLNCIAVLKQKELNFSSEISEDNNSWEIVKKPGMYISGMWEIALKLYQEKVNKNPDIV